MKDKITTMFYVILRELIFWAVIITALLFLILGGEFSISIHFQNIKPFFQSIIKFFKP